MAGAVYDSRYSEHPRIGHFSTSIGDLSVTVTFGAAEHSTR